MACGLFVGLLVSQIFGFLDFWIVGLLVYWFIGLLDCWIVGLLLVACVFSCLLVNVGVDCSVNFFDVFDIFIDDRGARGGSLCRPFGLDSTIHQ